MTDDLTTIETRWAGVALSYAEDAGDGYLATTTYAVRVPQPTDDDRAILRLAAHAPADIAALLSALAVCEATLTARSLTVAELLSELEKAQTAQRNWTEIGAKAEARLVRIRDALIHGLGLANELGDGERWAAWRLSAHNALNDESIDAPLLGAAQKIVAAWDRLCDCIAEFEDYNLEAMACGELKQYLDDAIVGLKGLLAGERGERASLVSPERLATGPGKHERLEDNQRPDTDYRGES